MDDFEEWLKCVLTAALFVAGVALIGVTVFTVASLVWWLGSISPVWGVLSGFCALCLVVGTGMWFEDY